MRTLLIIWCLLLSSQTILAATYKWEDADGVHFTDNASSIPEKYRSEALANAGVDSTSTAKSGGSDQPRIITTTQPYSNPPGYEQGQQHTDAYTVKPQNTITPPKSYGSGTAQLEKALATAGFFMFMYMLAILALFVAWIYCLVDIIRSEFKDPNSRVIWIILMVLVAPIAVPLYLLMGGSQKKATVSSKERRNFKTTGPRVR